MRPTFFNHFCAGEDEVSIVPTINYLQNNGIGAILDYAAEADVVEEEEGSGGEGGDGVDVGAAAPPAPSSVSATLPTPPPPSSSSSTISSHHTPSVSSSRREEDRLGVSSARVYDYTTELQCDENAKIFDNAIRAVHNVTPTGYVWDAWCSQA